MMWNRMIDELKDLLSVNTMDSFYDKDYDEKEMLDNLQSQMETDWKNIIDNIEGDINYAWKYIKRSIKKEIAVKFDDDRLADEITDEELAEKEEEYNKLMNQMENI